VIDTPLLVVGHGPAALVVARVASDRGIETLLAGHETIGGEDPVPLDAESVAVLERHGALDILRPFLTSTDPPTVEPNVFEQVLKHHSVADMRVTVFDTLQLVDVVPRDGPGSGLTGVLTDGRARWDVKADAFINADDLPAELPAAIAAAADAVEAVLAAGA
jgi:hypothetical protein